ncbi:MAG: hypothetical protein M3Z46_06350 [Actinomycetota bacterium]|nr:hypothetical protein [Actinomycetota bacterium]
MPVPTRPPTTSDPDVPASSGRSWTLGRVLTVLIVLGLVVFWIWILSGAPSRNNPDRIDDRAFVTTMRVQCTAATKAINRLTPASESHTAAERADVVDQATTILTTLIDRIEADAPRTGDDGVRFRGWIRDWRTYLSDRRDYSRRLRVNPGARLLLDVNKAHDSVDRAITNFADINDSPSCEAPGDVS